MLRLVSIDTASMPAFWPLRHLRQLRVCCVLACLLFLRPLHELRLENYASILETIGFRLEVSRLRPIAVVALAHAEPRTG